MAPLVRNAGSFPPTISYNVSGEPSKLPAVMFTKMDDVVPTLLAT